MKYDGCHPAYPQPWPVLASFQGESYVIIALCKHFFLLLKKTNNQQIPTAPDCRHASTDTSPCAPTCLGFLCALKGATALTHVLCWNLVLNKCIPNTRVHDTLSWMIHTWPSLSSLRYSNMHTFLDSLTPIQSVRRQWLSPKNNQIPKGLQL